MSWLNVISRILLIIKSKILCLDGYNDSTLPIGSFRWWIDRWGELAGGRRVSLAENDHPRAEGDVRLNEASERTRVASEGEVAHLGPGEGWKPPKIMNFISACK